MEASPDRDRGPALCMACPARIPTDALTGLVDRSTFRTRLKGALADWKPDTSGPAVLMVDLDRFKAVNDSLGYPAGDALLRIAAKRLRAAVRGGDLAARLGGDEFAVLLAAPVTPEAAAMVAARLVELLGRPYMVQGQAASVGASVGLAFAEADCTTHDALIGRADIAMYQVKANGRGRVGFFSPSLQQRAELRRQTEPDLRAALPLGQLELFYQPQYELAVGQLIGFEALLRWRHPLRGLVPPDEFIPLAEEIRLISSLGEWVLRTACTECARWPGTMTVAVNVAAQQFESGRLVGIVEAALQGAGLPGSRLELEITESALLNGSSGLVSGQLKSLKAMGVAISLDDFGTGYSSLSQLRSFPFDRVKIDRSFVNDVAVVRAITAMGASMGMRTTAEGVETVVQLDNLRREGCHEVQGYLLGRPLPASAIPETLPRLFVEST